MKQKRNKNTTKNQKSVQIQELANFCPLYGFRNNESVDQKLKIGEELIKMENISFCFTAEHKFFSLFSKVLNLTFSINKLI